MMNDENILNEETITGAEAKARALEIPQLSWIKYLPIVKPISIGLAMLGSCFLAFDALKKRRFWWVLGAFISPFNIFYMFRHFTGSKVFPLFFYLLALIAGLSSRLVPIFTRKVFKRDEKIYQERKFSLSLPWLKEKPFNVLQVSYRHPVDDTIPDKIEPVNE